MVWGARVWRFDRTGRFEALAEPGRAVRRGLDHRMVESVAVGPGAGSYRQYRDLEDSESDGVIAGALAAVDRAKRSGAPDIPEAAFRRMRFWTPDVLRLDRGAFRMAYQPVAILPPDRYRDVVVQITHGCSYNRCAFCDFYRDRPFHIQTDAELRAHLHRVVSFFGERLQDRTGLFLGDGNALVTPFARLAQMLGAVREALPAAEKGGPRGAIGAFMDTFDLKYKTDAQLRALRALGLDAVYMGLESGHDAVREGLRKPGTAQEACAAVRRLKEAGYRVGVMVLVGVGGPRWAEAHEQATSAALGQMALDRGDVIYLSPLVPPAPAPDGQTEWLQPMAPEELAGRYRAWRRRLAEQWPRVRVSLYPVQHHLY